MASSRDAAQEVPAKRRFPRGFYYGPTPPPDFRPSPFAGLFYNSRGAHAHAVIGDAEVVVLGSCLDVTDPEHTDPAERLARALTVSPDAFFDTLDIQAGRHAVFFRAPGLAGVLSDATGCRTIFYSDAAIASHTGLLSDAEAQAIPFARGFPGNRTPVPDVRILTPNTRIDLATHAVSRFWPRRAPEPLTLDEAHRRVETYARNALSKTPPLALGLTAGIDSRVIAVVARKAGLDLLTFTYDKGAPTATDAAIAPLAARALGFRHVTVPAGKPSRKMRDRLTGATYYNHHFSCVEPLGEALEGRAATVGTLLEIGRGIYNDRKRQGRDLSTPEQMVAHYFFRLRGPVQANIDAYGRDAWTAMATEAFAEFDAVSDFQSATRFVDPFDLFYWEHRMGTWHALILLERDFYAEPVMPLNCRAIFTAMMGLPRPAREDAVLFARLLAVPELAGVPLVSSNTAALSTDGQTPAAPPTPAT